MPKDENGALAGCFTEKGRKYVFILAALTVFILFFFGRVKKTVESDNDSQ